MFDRVRSAVVRLRVLFVRRTVRNVFGLFVVAVAGGTVCSFYPRAPQLNDFNDFMYLKSKVKGSKGLGKGAWGAEPEERADRPMLFGIALQEIGEKRIARCFLPGEECGTGSTMWGFKHPGPLPFSRAPYTYRGKWVM